MKEHRFGVVVNISSEVWNLPNDVVDSIFECLSWMRISGCWSRPERYETAEMTSEGEENLGKLFPHAVEDGSRAM